MKVIILAGGSGKRLWPLSSDVLPKQFQDFGMDSSLLKQTAARFSEKSLLITTHKKHLELVQDQLGPSLEKSVLLEPTARNTAPRHLP